MNKTLLTFLIAFCFIASTFAQAPCATMEHRHYQMKTDSLLQQKIDAYEAALQVEIKNNKLSAKRAVYTIPVVVHVLYKKDTQNIPDQRIFDQIAITNRDFAGLNPHSMGAFSNDLKANTGIQFCLAKQRPDGSGFNGINRVQTNVDSFVWDNKMKFSASGGVDAWDPSRYLNIWVCNYDVVDALGYVFSAYAQFPSSGINSTYGVAIRYGAFGPSDSTYYRGNGGILTHELGHCMNVYHIWGDDDSSCAGSDLCDDSPNQANRSTGIISGLLTDKCSPNSPGVMYMNFMDYCDDIVYANFTPDQAARMQANFSANSDLLKLSQSSVCDFSVGMRQAPPAFAIQVFPNPATDVVSISSSVELPANAEILLYDLYGRLLHSELWGTSRDCHLNLHHLSKGVYTVALRVNGHLTTSQLLIN